MEMTSSEFKPLIDGSMNFRTGESAAELHVALARVFFSDREMVRRLLTSQAFRARKQSIGLLYSIHV